MRKNLILSLIVSIGVYTPSLGLTASDDDVYIRVVDVGAGECAVIRMPGEHYIVYDAGNWRGAGTKCMEAIRDIVSGDQSIDVLVLSHTDGDHLGAVKKIFAEYFVDHVLHTGHDRAGSDSKTLVRARKAIDDAREAGTVVDLNLAEIIFPAGATYRFGDVFVTMVCGFGVLPDDWDLKDNSERNNAPSIVIRIQYHGRSVLLCGDAVGRHLGDADDAAPIATEKYMLEQKSIIAIKSDVLIAPHHGADNASSTEFIKAVSPHYVVFSAGHKYQHPRKVTAERYITAGLKKNNMLRTDYGDDEAGDEWAFGRVAGAEDAPGDDDVDVVLTREGRVKIDYRDSHHPAPDPD